MSLKEVCGLGSQGASRGRGGPSAGLPAAFGGEQEGRGPSQPAEALSVRPGAGGTRSRWAGWEQHPRGNVRCHRHVACLGLLYHNRAEKPPPPPTHRPTASMRAGRFSR